MVIVEKTYLLSMKIFRLLLLLNSFTLLAQEFPHADYINKYAHFAREEMSVSGVPASITLAQGILESGNGTSQLSRDGFNHFGIKCKKHYEGKVMFVDDDEVNDCFRVYESVLDSYKDHSNFLKNNQRYAGLFKLNPKDYKGWARGLKKAGYATNPKYAQLLIDIIEDNKLYLFDESKDKWVIAYQKHTGVDVSVDGMDVEGLEQNEGEDIEVSLLNSNKSLSKYERVYTNDNGSVYVLAKPGDTFEKLKDRHDVWISELKRFNELSISTDYKGGEKVYIRPKKNKASVREYVVKSGDSLYSIAQFFGVKQKKILRKNKLKSAHQIVPGMRLKLR